MARASRGSKQQARTIAYALARPLRGLRRGFEVGERLDHLFLFRPYVKPMKSVRRSSKNFARRVQNRPPDPLGASLWPPGAHSGPPEPHFGPPGARFGLLGRSWGSPRTLSGASGEPLGDSRARARFSKHFGCHFGSIFGPPGPRKSTFRVEGLHVFR